MAKKTILIVEDEVMIADDIKADLEDSGFLVPMRPCHSYKQAVESLKTMRPDLVLLDINLKGNLSGIDLAAHINEHYGIPFLFLTSHWSPEIINKAGSVYPAGFISKPYSSKNLWANIEIALQRQQLNPENKNVPINTEEDLDNMILSKLLYLKAQGSYTRYYFENSNFVKREYLKEALAKIKNTSFIQVHRSFAVNPQKVTSVSSNKLHIGKIGIPISRSKQEEILQLVRAK